MFLYQSSARICYFEAVSLFLSSSLAWMMLCIFLDSFCQVGSENSPIMKQTAWITMIILIYENILIYKNINFIQNIKITKLVASRISQEGFEFGIWVQSLQRGFLLSHLHLLLERYQTHDVTEAGLVQINLAIEAIIYFVCFHRLMVEAAFWAQEGTKSRHNASSLSWCKTW